MRTDFAQSTSRQTSTGSIDAWIHVKSASDEKMLVGNSSIEWRKSHAAIPVSNCKLMCTWQSIYLPHSFATYSNTRTYAYTQLCATDTHDAVEPSVMAKSQRQSSFAFTCLQPPIDGKLAESHSEINECVLFLFLFVYLICVVCAPLSKNICISLH